MAHVHGFIDRRLRHQGCLSFGDQRVHLGLEAIKHGVVVVVVVVVAAILVSIVVPILAIFAICATIPMVLLWRRLNG